jgi:hypothetical protein
VRKWKETNTEASERVEVLFYDDNRVLSSLCAEIVQYAMDNFVKLFGQIGLVIDASKTKAMVTAPGQFPIGISSPTYRMRMKGTGANACEWRALKVHCPMCQNEMLATSSARHLANVHQ